MYISYMCDKQEPAHLCVARASGHHPGHALEAELDAPVRCMWSWLNAKRCFERRALVQAVVNTQRVSQSTMLTDTTQHNTTQPNARTHQKQPPAKVAMAWPSAEALGTCMYIHIITQCKLGPCMCEIG